MTFSQNGFLFDDDGRLMLTPIAGGEALPTGAYQQNGFQFDEDGKLITLSDSAQSGSAAIAVLEDQQLWNGGHSFMAGVVYALLKRLVPRNNMDSFNNRAAGGATAGETIDQIRTINAVLYGYFAVMALINGVSGSHTAATLREEFRSIFAHLTYRVLQAVNAGSFSFGSGWTSGVTSTAGSKFNFAWNGDKVYLVLAFTTGADVIWSIKDSGGTTLETFNTGGYSEAFKGVHKLSGFGSGDHQVTVTLESGAGGTVYDALIPNANPMTIFWLVEGPVQNFNSGQNAQISIYQQAIEAILSDFPTVVEVLPTGWNPDTMVISDGVHPNALGAAFWVDRVETEARALQFRQGQNFITGNTTASYSAPTATSPGGGGGTPSSSVAPAVTTDGTPASGEAITFDHGTWTASPTGYTWKMQRSTDGGSTWADISGATGTFSGSTPGSYTLVSGDSGNKVRVAVTATNGSGSTTANSSPVTVAGSGSSIWSGSHLKTWATDGHWVYALSPDDDLPTVPTGSTLTITSGSGWTPGAYTTGDQTDFATEDGTRHMVNLNAAPATPGSTGGVGSIA